MKKILLAATVPLSLKAFSLGLSFMEFLRERGYDVAAAAGPGSEAKSIRRAGFSFYEIPIPRKIRPFSDYVALRRLTDIICKERFDVVHTQTSKAGFIGRLAAHKTGVPLIIHTAHNWPFHPLLPFPIKRFYLTLEKKAARWCDALIVDTNAVKNYGIELGVAPKEHIHRIYMGIDLKRFRQYSHEEKLEWRGKYGISPHKIVIGCIARLVADKGIETFLACARELKDNDNLIFILGGEGKLRKYFERRVEEYGMRDKVIFTGHLDDVVPYLNMFDIFCLPTLREGFGVIFAEAQSCGVPVVGSDIEPLKEVIVDGVTGKRVPANDVRGFVDALRMFFDPKVRQEFAQAARRHIEDNFALQDIYEQTLALYRTLWEQKVKP